MSQKMLHSRICPTADIANKEACRAIMVLARLGPPTVAGIIVWSSKHFHSRTGSDSSCRGVDRGAIVADRRRR